ncbi:MAG TPA: chorismate synthase [Candidatus Krumholzibacteria bacterium]|nr:chorismate synthase [Candidatus Krumholzibacteria bacterium]
MSSSFGALLRVSTFGESHGGGVGVVLDGCPPRLALDVQAVQAQLDRRRPGQSRIATPRDEADQVEILSGVEDGLTLGTPIAMLVRNRDQRPGDYGAMAQVPRPSHADYTYRQKYGIAAASGGGRASARETIGRVAAGAVAEQWLRAAHGTDIVAWVDSVADVAAGPVDQAAVTRADVDATIVRCPDPAAADRMIAAIDAARKDHDSVGGVVTCVCRGVPAGLGEPVFGKFEALLAQAMLSLPAVKGFEIGSGFAGARLRGSAHNDAFAARPDGTLGTVTNRSGGVQGGISNGEPVVFRVAFKPPATIARPQATAGYDGAAVELAAPGRHDPCVVPRAVPIVEAMAALVLADLALLQAARGWPGTPRP